MCYMDTVGVNFCYLIGTLKEDINILLSVLLWFVSDDIVLITSSALYKDIVSRLLITDTVPVTIDLFGVMI